MVSGGGDSLWKWRNFRLSRAPDLDLGSSHTAYCHASLVDLYLHTKFHWNRRNVLWTDGRTYGQTFETHFIRSTRRSRRNKTLVQRIFMHSSLKRSEWHVLTRDRRFAGHPRNYPQMEWAVLPVILKRSASTHFGQLLISCPTEGRRQMAGMKNSHTPMTEAQCAGPH